MKAQELDRLFREAVSAIDAGNIDELERLLAAHPELVHERLTSPGDWLRDQVGQALEGVLREALPALVRGRRSSTEHTLPANIADVAGVIITAARREGVAGLQEQLDYALTLVSWSWVAEQRGVQIALIDVLLAAGASPQVTDSALVNGHLDAAEHLLARGASLTLGAAVCLGRLGDVPRLAQAADARERQMAFVLAALNGKAFQHC